MQIHELLMCKHNLFHLASTNQFAIAEKHELGCQIYEAYCSVLQSMSASCFSNGNKSCICK